MTHVTHRALSEVVRFYSGGTPARSNSDYWNGSIPWISPKDMRSAHIGSSEEHLTEMDVKESATRVVPSGSILIVARSGILARHLPVGVTTCPVSFNQDIKALVPEEDVEPRYVAAFLRSSEKYVLVQGVKKGATVHSIKSGFIESLRIPFPKLPEQRRIADVIELAISEADMAARAADLIRAECKSLCDAILSVAFR